MRVKFDEMEKYVVKKSNRYFSLKDDGDVARVRFMFDDLNDLPIRVHEVKVDGYNRKVGCLREYDDPVHKCPLCESGNNPYLELYIPLIEEDEEDVKFWTRPYGFGPRISSKFARYKNFPSHIFEIERIGKAGNKNTTYELTEIDSDDTKLSDYDVPSAVGTVVLDKTAEEMENYLATGSFDNNEEEQPVRRRDSQERTGRRTPANTRNTDRF